MKLVELPDMVTDSIAVEVGCALSYRAQEASEILLLIRPSQECSQFVLHEQVRVRSGAGVEQLTDGYGNRVMQVTLLPGLNEIRHEAVLRLPVLSCIQPDQVDHERKSERWLPLDIARYTLPSRYCESDKLAAMARRLFGGPCRVQTVQDICDWTHGQILYKYGSGDSTLSACEAIDRGYGVCRDYAHVMIALCRALDLPARYVAGHMPLLGNPKDDSDIGIDFHAYVEVYLDGRWHVYDPRHNDSSALHVKVAHGLDAVDAAISTYYGPVQATGFTVWAHRLGAGDGANRTACGESAGGMVSDENTQIVTFDPEARRAAG